MHFRDVLPALVGKRLTHRVNGDKYGIELEVEGSRLPRPEHVSAFWRVEHDGSLRPKPEAFEYKTLSLTYKQALKAIALFNEAAVSNKTAAAPSVRTSVHIHRNIQQLNVIEITSLIITYMILEYSFYSIAGPEREGNLFCIPLNHCEKTLKTYAGMVNSIARDIKFNSRDLEGDGKKYHALNFKTMFSYGTLEFRIHEGTIDEERLVRWLTCIENMTNYAKTRNPLEVLQDVSACGLAKFGELVLGKKISDTITYRHDDFYSAVDNAHLLAYAADWDALKHKYVNSQVSLSERDLLHNHLVDMLHCEAILGMGHIPRSSMHPAIRGCYNTLTNIFDYDLFSLDSRNDLTFYRQSIMVMRDTLIRELRLLEPEYRVPTINLASTDAFLDSLRNTSEAVEATPVASWVDTVTINVGPPRPVFSVGNTTGRTRA